MVDIYHTQISKLTGTDYREVLRKANAVYRKIASKTKRKPYVRSMYFKKEKIFLNYFWQHLYQKNRPDRLRRLEFYACALDLVVHSRVHPNIMRNPEKQSEVLYRFKGITRTKEFFTVQIKEDPRNKNKHFISVYPE